MGKLLLGILIGIFIGALTAFCVMALLMVGSNDNLKNLEGTTPNGNLNAEIHSGSDKENGVC